MYFLIWIYENCQPGRCYGPMELKECNETMLRYVKEDKDKDPDDHLDEYSEDDHYINSEFGDGWYIIKSEEAN